MKTGFKNPIESDIKSQEKKSPWDYRMPDYDERSSCYVNAGSHWGLGHKNPVGHEGKPVPFVSTLPLGRVKTLETYKYPESNLDQEYQK